MKKILLNNILNLTEDEINRSKIALNMGYGGKTHLVRWYESDENNREVDFSYYSHQGQSRNRNFTYVGQWCFGFVQLSDDNKKWLLVTAGEITDLVDHGTCGHIEMERFAPLVGRLIVKIHKGNTFSRYAFNMSRWINEAEVVEILPNIYEPLQWQGYNNVHLTFKQLQIVCNGGKYARYRDALKLVKGVYCLTDKKTGKLYIGSAYGQDGVAQRWNCYLNDKTGGNVEFIELYNSLGEDYFSENFTFTLLEYFGSGVTDKEIIHREGYWKKVFQSKEYGYNDN